MKRTFISPLSIAVVAIVVAVLVLPTAAFAGSVIEADLQATLDIQADGLPSTSSKGPGFTTGVDFGSKGAPFGLPEGAIRAAGSAAADSKGDTLASVRFDGSSGAGTLDGSGGNLPVEGSLWVRFLAAPFADIGEVELPLSPLGGGGAQTVSTTTASGDQWSFRVDGGPWQTGTISLTSVRGTVNNGQLNTTSTQAVGTLTGVDDRTITPTSGLRVGGQLRLVGPMRIVAMRTSAGLGSFLEVPLGGRLVIPEPGLLALQLAAAGVLAAAGWSRRKKK